MADQLSYAPNFDDKEIIIGDPTFKWGDDTDDDEIDYDEYRKNRVQYFINNPDKLLLFSEKDILRTVLSMTSKEKCQLGEVMTGYQFKYLGNLLPLPTSYGFSGSNKTNFDGLKEWVEPEIIRDNNTINENWEALEEAWDEKNFIKKKIFAPKGFFFSVQGIIPSFHLNPGWIKGSIIAFENRVAKVHFSKEVHAHALSVFFADRSDHWLCLELCALNLKMWLNTQDEDLIEADTQKLINVLKPFKIEYVNVIQKNWELGPNGEKIESSKTATEAKKIEVIETEDRMEEWKIQLSKKKKKNNIW